MRSRGRLIAAIGKRPEETAHAVGDIFCFQKLTFRPNFKFFGLTKKDSTFQTFLLNK